MNFSQQVAGMDVKQAAIQIKWVNPTHSKLQFDFCLQILIHCLYVCVYVCFVRNPVCYGKVKSNQHSNFFNIKLEPRYYIKGEFSCVHTT